MKKIFAILLFTMTLVPAMSQAFSGSEVHISKDGTASVSGAKVMQLAGSTMYARLYWGDAYVRFLVKTNPQTKFFRATGEVTTIKEVSVGDLLEISGQLESGTDTLVVVASSVKNSSVQKAQATFSGKVTYLLRLL